MEHRVDATDEDGADEHDADEHLLKEAEKIAVALGRMFPGLCEVVLHDLRDPEHAIRAIENNLSGRQIGDPATELGLARISDPDYPGVVQNYPNRFPDGRPAKSTSIGIKNAAGEYVAALCLNLDVSVLSPSPSPCPTSLRRTPSTASGPWRPCATVPRGSCARRWRPVPPSAPPPRAR